MRIKRSISKPMALLLAVILVLGVMSSSAFAEDGTSIANSGATAAVCTHVHDENCGYAEDEVCIHEHDEDCGGLPYVDSASSPVPGDFSNTSTLIDANTISAFGELPEETLWQGYDMGEIESQNNLILPFSLDATTISGATITIDGVAWQSDPPFDPDVSAFYNFTPKLQRDYVLAEGLSLPVISVFIKPMNNRVLALEKVLAQEQVTVSSFAQLESALDNFNRYATADTTILIGADFNITSGLVISNADYCLTITSSNTTRTMTRHMFNTDTLFTVTNNAKLVFGNIVIDGNKSSFVSGWTSLVRINFGGAFTMNDGTILRNNAAEYGGGIYVNDGALTMNGGSISGNSDSYGGAVYLNGGTFTMNDGTISGDSNNLRGGSGVYISGGTFIMNDGVIRENSSGGVRIISGKFTMEGGEITRNSVDGSGGGVYVNSNSTFDMNGGIISSNSAVGTYPSFLGGGGVFNIGIFTMNAGKIIGNSANYGGSVHNQNMFTMTGGEISGNFDYWNGSQSAGSVYNSGSIEVYNTPVIGTATNNNAISREGQGSINIGQDGLLNGAYINIGTHTNDTLGTVIATKQGGGTILPEEAGFFNYPGNVLTTAVDGANIVLSSTVIGVTVSPDTASVRKGWQQTFIANVQRVKDPVQTVTWTVDGGIAGTSITQGGVLTVAFGETATELIVRATSTADINKSGTASVTVTEAEPLADIVLNFTQLQNAINYFNTGSTEDTTIYIGADFDITSNLTISNRNHALKIISDGTTRTLTRNFDESGSLFIISDGAELIFENIIIDGGRALFSISEEALVKVILGGSFIMNDSTVLRNWKSNGSGVYNSGAFTMNGGKISDNEGWMVGGVYNYGTFTMNGGEISGNSGHVGGIYSNGAFIMRNGKINDNSGGLGGGVRIEYEYGTFTMSGGNISDNFGSGVTLKSLSSNHSFTMSGGEISGNTGSGVEVAYLFGQTSTFIMDGGEIKDNNLEGVYSTGTFIMNNGEIKNNNLTGRGTGGVWNNDGTFIMNGGKINGNQSDGVYSYGTFTMRKGEINNNIGYGVSTLYDWAGSAFTMSGGEISGNIGGGVYWWGGTVEISGSPVIGTATDGNSLIRGVEVIRIGQTGLSNGAFINVESHVNDAVGTVIATKHGGGAVTPAEAGMFNYLGTLTTGFNGANVVLIDPTQVTAGDFQQLQTAINNFNSSATADTTILIGADFNIEANLTISNVNHTLTIRSDNTTTRTLTRGFLNRYTNSGLFIVSSGADLILEDIVIDGNSGIYESNSAPLVWIIGGVFTMNNGAVLRNNRAYDGGGVVIYMGGTLNMEGGEISGNQSSSGGGVNVLEGTFNMEGGEITGNRTFSMSGGGGVYVSVKGTFNMNGGKINRNTADSYGGVCNAGTFTMSGGQISDNNSAGMYDNGRGGGVYNSDTFTISGGEISGNFAGFGGGVYNTATFIMSGGEISGNFAGSGGGVENTATFTMNSGKISDNTASYRGGGVRANMDSTFTMNGGEIGRNIANEIGNGVYLADSSSLSLAGTPVIRDGIYMEGALPLHVSIADNLESCASIVIEGSFMANQMEVGTTVANYTGTGVITNDTARAFVSNDGSLNSLIGTVSGNSVVWGSAFDADTSFTRLRDSIAAYETAAQDKTIIIGEDITLIAPLSIPANINGKTLTITSDHTTRTLMRGYSDTDSNSGLFVVSSGATLILENIVIDGDKHKPQHEKNRASIIYVSGYPASFELREGAVLTNNIADYGGVYVGGGTFTMNGGEISDNITRSYGYGGGGGGVCVGFGTFTMNSGKISGNTAFQGGGGVCGYGGTFTMNGGEISGNTADSGGGAYFHGMSFTMNDGDITGNIAITGDGGGVFLWSTSSSSRMYFTMNGGEISGNTAKLTGGGVSVTGRDATNTVFVMRGGSITRNSAGNGGGVFNTAVFYMGGGEITGNTADDGAGVLLWDNGTIVISDAAVIGTTVDENAITRQLATQAISIEYSGLTSDASINLDSHADDVQGTVIATKSGSRAVTPAEAATLHYLGYFFCVVNGADVVLTAGEPTEVTVTNFAQLQAAIESFNNSVTGDTTILIDADFDIEANLEITNTNHTLTIKSDDSTRTLTCGFSNTSWKRGLFIVSTGGRLVIEDIVINGNRGGIYTGQVSLVSINGGEFIMNSGTILRNNNTSNGGSVFIDEGGTFIMNDGEISDNTAFQGGGVYVAGEDGTFTMNGGKISGNIVSGGGGGGVYVQRGIFNMNGGEISGNTASRDGGGVMNNGTFTMSGGKIRDNISAWGGGVYVGTVGTFTMISGEISSNTASNRGDSVYLHAIYDDGIDHWRFGTIEISGASVIGTATDGNTITRAEAWQVITIGEEVLSDGAYINIAPHEDDAVGTVIATKQGGSPVTTAEARVFNYLGDKFICVADGTNVVLIEDGSELITIGSDVYTIDPVNRFMKGIEPGTTVAHLLANINVISGSLDKSALKVYSLNEVQITGSQLAGTGSYITVDGANEKLGIVVVYGDVTGSGEVTSTDALLVLRKASGRSIIFDDSQIAAAKVTGNAEITSTDALLILRKASGRNVVFTP